MMNNNGRPLSRKQTVRLLIALTILAWATQTLLRQWGYGAEIPTTQSGSLSNQPEVIERFVPPSSGGGVGAILELRPDATVIGGEVKLRQVCRWSDRDKALFDPIGDLVLVHLAPQAPFKSISIQEIRGTLRDAGVNTATINFAGATLCTIARSDVQYDEKTALDQWITARQGAAQDQEASAAASPKSLPVQASAPTSMPAVADSTDPINPVKTLRQSLIDDLATRLNLPADSLQVDFKAEDEKVLNIATPMFRFDLEAVRVRSLGTVAWNVTISGSGKDSSRRKVTIAAEARAWQSQVVVSKPLAAKEIIRQADLVQRRALVEELSADPPVTMDQCVGQLASRDLKPGMVLTGRMIDPVQLVKIGQFVTITLDQGTVQIKTVARALEAGSLGQTIRVKNEATRDVFQVVVTGPQTATMNLSAPVASVGQ